MVLIVEQDPDVVETTADDAVENDAGTTGEAPKHQPGATVAHPADELLDEELLVEEISIDGMCGVY